MSLLPPQIRVIERGWLSANNIVFHEGAEATLVDSGYVTHAGQTLALLEHALEGRKLARLINTHSHSDHIGGNASVRRAHGCRILVPEGMAPAVADWDEDALLLSSAHQQAEQFEFDATIAPGDEFEMGGLRWQALHVPGHDMHALAYYAPRERILISGDALWQDGFGIIFGEILGRKEALPATRATLEMIGRLAVDIVIPGHGAPFDDVDAAMARALRRLESFEADSTRVGRNAVRACFTFNLLDLQRLREDELPAYLKSVPFFDHVNVTMLGFSDEDFASWLLGELLRSKSIEIKDGWILPTMAP